MVLEKPKEMQGPETPGLIRYRDWIVAVILLTLSLSMSAALYSPYLYEWDSVQFALALDHFSLALHQPHPPGYPVYVFIGKVFNVFLSDKALALNSVSIVFGALSIIFTYLLAKEMFGWKAGFLAAILIAISPAHLLLSNVAMTDVVSTCLIVMSIYLLYTGLKNGPNFLAGSLAASLAIGVRPQHVFFMLVLLGIFLFWKKECKTILVSSLLFIAGILAWMIPLLALNGGPSGYYALLNSQLTGIVRLHFAPEQFYSLVMRMLDGWTKFDLIFFTAVAALALVWRLVGEKSTALKKLPENKPFILFSAWVIAALANIIYFENLYTVRYLLPVFPPVAMTFAFFTIDIRRRLRPDHLRFAYDLLIAAALLVTAILSLSLAAGIQASPPAPVQAAYYISEHYQPNSTLILTGESYRHFQYYLPEYSRGSSDYSEAAGAGMPLIVSESPMTLDNSTPVAVFQKADIINYKHSRVELYETGLMDCLFVNGGFYPVEYLDGAQIRWTTRNATIIYNSSSARDIDMRFEAISYNKPRTMQVYLNGELAHEQRIDAGPGSVRPFNFTSVTVPLKLEEGKNTIIIHSVEEPQSLRDISMFNQIDTRELCFALRNVTIAEDKLRLLNRPMR